MAAKKRAAQAGAGAFAAGKAARDNPYVARLIEDEDLRENLRTAYDSARKAYERMSNGKGPAKAVMDDKKKVAESHPRITRRGATIRSVGRRREGRRGLWWPQRLLDGT